MMNSTCLIRCNAFLLFITFILCVSLNSYGDDFIGSPENSCLQDTPPETILLERGYSLDEESMKNILNSHTPLSTKLACLEYVRDEKTESLAPDVEKYYHSLVVMLDDKKKAIDRKDISIKEKESRIKDYDEWVMRREVPMMRSIECLFAIYPEMPKEKIDEYLKRVRYSLFDRRMPDSKYPPTFALNPLVSAWRNQNVNIKDDLIKLIKSDRIHVRYPIHGFFHQYGDQVSEQELADILDSLEKKGSDKVPLFLMLSHDRGKLLDRKVADSNQH